MSDRLDLFFRAHTVPVTPQKKYRSKRRANQPKDALIFRCVTTGDERQDLLFGAYVCAELQDSQFVAKEIGLFHRGGHPEELRILKRFAKNSAFELGSEREFRRVFLNYMKAGARIVAYDAPREISRIAVKSNKSKKWPRAFSFYFRMFQDKKTGKMRPSGYEPGLSIESLDASKAIYRLIKYKFHEKDAEREEREEEQQQFSDVHVIDPKTLASVLTGEAHTFPSACEIFGVPASRARKTRPRVTKPAIEALLKDVTAELELLNRLKPEFERHPLDLAPERCYSPATLDTTYFSALGIKPPQQQFNIPHGIHGIAEQAFVAGRAECTIRRTLLPVTYLDFHAQFPAVSKLLDCREILCAESLEFADFTAGAREMVERTTVDDCFRPEFWKRSRWFTLVEPNEDVLRTRAKFGQREDSDPTLGWNFLTSKQPFWVTGPDVIAAKLQTGKPLKILKAIQVIPHGVQSGLVPVKLYSQMSAVVQDLRRAIVLFKNAPASACVGIVTLALGIGVNTAIFSLVEAILWQPLQAHNPNRLVTLYTSGSHGIGYSPTSYPDYEYYRDHANVLSGLAAYARIRMTWSDTDQPEFSWAELVSTNYFDVLGIQPVIGRSFLAEDDTRSVIVVSHRFWRAHLGSNSHLIGTTLLLNGRSFTIVGIAPRNFEGIVLDWGSPPEFWIPIGMHREVLRAGGHGDFRRDHHARWLLLTGRLRDGATLSECRAEENVLAKQLGNSFPEPESEGGRTVIALPLKEARFWPTWRSSIVMVLSLLAGAAALVLFIACFNIAILLLVGASVRRKEFATRLALGASRARLIRQLLTENLVFTGAGTVLGLLVAYWMMGILPRFQLPFAIPLTFNLRIDTDVLLFATVLAFVSVLLSGLLSALHATKSDRNCLAHRGG